MTDKTLRELQTSLPWTVHYHHDFRASPMTHKDFGHALLHVQKAAGKLAALVNDAEHGGCDFKPEDTDRFVADLVVCALRMANTCPGHVIDLQSEVEARIATKNGEGVPQGGYSGPALVPTGLKQCGDCSFATGFPDRMKDHRAYVHGELFDPHAFIASDFGTNPTHTATCLCGRDINDAYHKLGCPKCEFTCFRSEAELMKEHLAAHEL